MFACFKINAIQKKMKVYSVHLYEKENVANNIYAAIYMNTIYICYESKILQTFYRICPRSSNNLEAAYVTLHSFESIFLCKYIFKASYTFYSKFEKTENKFGSKCL